MINWAHVHLIINHFPVVGVMGAILLLLYALVRKSEEVKMVSFGAFVLVALITIPVYLTGDPASDVVKKLPGVTEAAIDTHEEVASYALVLMEILGAASLAGLFLLRLTKSIPKWLIMVVLILSCMTTAVIGLAANLGGQIRHTEIRTGAPSTPATMPAR